MTGVYLVITFRLAAKMQIVKLSGFICFNLFPNDSATLLSYIFLDPMIFKRSIDSKLSYLTLSANWLGRKHFVSFQNWVSGEGFVDG